MKNFLTENWFKICILLIGLMFVTIFAYFYNKQIIIKQQEQKSLSMEKCSEDGPKFVSDVFSSSDGTGVTKEWFVYSSELKTCLADITDVRYAASPTNRVTYAIYDIYSDKEIVFYSLNLTTEQVIAGDRDSFDSLEKRYFSN